MKLHVLANGDVCHAASVLFRQTRDGSRLGAGQQSVGNADAHHKVRYGFAFAIFAANHTDAIALGVDSPRAEVGAHPRGRDRRKAGTGELFDLVKVFPGVYFAFKALDALRFCLCDFGHRCYPC